MDGERLKELRQDKHMTQQNLAELLELHISSIKAYEQSRSSPSDETKVKIAELFNISLDYLLGAIREELPLRRPNVIDLPKNFTVNDIAKVRCYIEKLRREKVNPQRSIED